MKFEFGELRPRLPGTGGVPDEFAECADKEA
jgi:hypothetical protein